MRKIAFTMAEILLSLTIIGVVAAITLPSLTGNINERTWNTQRKALYARMSQAIALMPALNGFGQTAGTVNESTGEQTLTNDTGAETLVASGLSKVLKINNICGNDNLADCGIPTTINVMYNGGTISVGSIATLGKLNETFLGMESGSYYSENYHAFDTKAVAFETQNGESILLHYNPGCRGDLNETTDYSAVSKMCINMIYDLNGSKGPNTVGKDIGAMSVLYPSDSTVVMPVPYHNITSATAISGLGAACRAADEEYRVPNREEVMSIFYNSKLFFGGASDWGAFSISYFVSSSRFDENYFWEMETNGGRMKKASSGSETICVKR